MNKVKKQISELRASMPKYVQWLLLVAAFIVVLILLTLLLTGKKNSDDVKAADSEPVEINISNDNIDWSDTRVGDKKNASIKITSSAPARVAVRTTKEIAGLSARHTCNSGEVTANIPCTITLEYVPTMAMDNTGVPIYIDYRGASEPEELNITDKIMLTVGAVSPAPAPVKQPEPVIAPQPKVEPVVEPQPVRQEIVREIETIAPSDPFANYKAFEPDPIVLPEPEIEIPSEKCSDFAFPGYNSSGMQIGWIRPERGAYYFHPFADKDCNNPTGVYNPDTGFITDIKDISKKIGTDAEHIGYSMIPANGALPQLQDSPRSRNANRYDDDMDEVNGFARVALNPNPSPDVLYESTGDDTVVSTPQYDRTFILRQYKPIPATIVSDVRADAVLNQTGQLINFPVRATVDRNVYADNGRTVIIPTGTLLLGYVTGDVPGPYKAIGRMQIRWYQFVLPNGVEFNFYGNESDPFSGDSQGRVGVPGRGSTDYLEQFVMPMLTAIVPAAVNMIAPIADKFVNQIDLDNNTVVQSGTVRSSELAKNEIITAWNQVAQKLMVDMMDNTVPPFTIPAGTRITVYSPVDLQVACDVGGNKKCSVKSNANIRTSRVNYNNLNGQARAASDDSWVGQVRSFNWSRYCKDGKVDETMVNQIYAEGLDYRNVLFYCQTNQYQAINNARQDAIFQAQQNAFSANYGNASNTGQGMWGNGNTNAGGINGGGLTGIVGDATYNENVLGLVQDENGYLSLPKEEAPVLDVLTCLDGSLPDVNGCCAGEIYTDMGEMGFNCCPEAGGDCFPPIQ